MTGIIWYYNKKKAEYQLTELIARYTAIDIKVEEYKKGTTQESVLFENGDFWRTYPANRSTKGNRCNISFVERSIPLDFYETVIRPVTSALPYHAVWFYGSDTI